MQTDQLALLLFAAAAVFFCGFAVVALAKARRRRRAEFAEPQARDAGVGEGEVEAEVEAEAEAESEAEPESEVEPESEAEPEREGELATAPAAPVVAREPEPGVDEGLRRGLAKTHASFFGRLAQLFGGGAKVDTRTIDELEDVLLLADVGVKLTTRLVGELRARVAKGQLDSQAAVRAALRERMLAALAAAGANGGDPLEGSTGASRPRVILFVGVNGVGKTTTIGKVASQLRERGRSVVMAAGDTFRAAATQQLAIWGERTGSRVIMGEEGADPASVIFNAIRHATEAAADVVLADTAGRLHTKTELMDEIKKVKRAAGKARDGAPDETWLVVDATTGQNALQQAREFHETLGLTGIILTKLDGTAKGGVVVNIVDDLRLPVRFVGVGEKANDLRPFSSHGFVAALFSDA